VVATHDDSGVLDWMTEVRAGTNLYASEDPILLHGDEANRSTVDLGHARDDARKRSFQLHGDADTPAPQGNEIGHGDQEPRCVQDPRGCGGARRIRGGEVALLARRTLTREAHTSADSGNWK
jgi:hypothetical protein